MTSIQLLTERVRRWFAARDEPVSRATVSAAVLADPAAAVLGERTIRRLTERLSAELGGPGPLAPLLADPDVTDVLVNRDAVWVDRGQGLCRAAADLGGAEQVRRLAQRLASLANRRLDDACPFVDARLPDGTRLHAVLPPIARDGPYLSLRTFRWNGLSLPGLVQAGTVSQQVAELLRSIVHSRLPYLITGGTGSGKTTMLGALLALVPENERIVLVEDVAELRPDHPHVVALETRRSNVEGAGRVVLRDLVRHALRMRPDRLVIGECRGAEIVDLLGALNTGHEGGAATLHANASADVPARLEALGLLGGIPQVAVHAQVAAALRVVIQVRRTPAGRVVDEICLLSRAAGGLVSASAAWTRSGGSGPAARTLADLLIARGSTAPQVLIGSGSSAGSGPGRRIRWG